MSGSVTLYSKERDSNGEEQRKEIYYTAQDTPLEEAEKALSPSSVIFGVQTQALALNKQRIRAGKMYV
jgi:hypothetical protein